MAKPEKYHGLLTLASRRGWRRLDDVKRDDASLSERTVYRDSSTGCIVWRMTNDPAVDVDDYYDIPSWNADGSVMSFLSMRDGVKSRWLMDANGANLRPMPMPEGEPIDVGYWSIVDRDRFYYSVVDDEGTHVMALNPFTGEQTVIVGVDRDLGPMMPPHPTEEYFLFGQRQDPTNRDLADTPSTIYVVANDGAVAEVALERRWHRLRFTKSDDVRIFFNYDSPRTQWTIMPDGGERAEIPYSGGHPDWLSDGSELSFYADGSIWGVKYDGTARREIVNLKSGGHGGPCLDGEWFVSDTHGGADEALYPDSILYLRTDGSGIVHQIARPQSSFYNHQQRWHPDHHSTHPHPVASPDGTKSIYNSDMIGEFSDVYVAVNRFPDPPRGLVARLDGRSVVLNWKPPERCRELAGYCVYRFDEGADSWKRLSFRPQRGTGWRGPQRKAPAYYVITAVEHSGLESRPSNQVYQLGNELWDGHAELVFEVEDGTIEEPMSASIDMLGASDGYYVAAPSGEAGGSVALAIDLPKSGSFNIWARVKGEGSLAISRADQQLGSVDCTGKEWSWVSLGEAVELMSGENVLALSSSQGGECLDKVFLTDALERVPDGLMALDAETPDTPEGVKVEPVGPNALHLSWEAVKINDVDHYDVYCGTSAEIVPGVDTLVGSPAEAEFVDWGLKPGQSYWYRVALVDRSGNVSEPTEAIEGVVPSLEPARIALEARRAKRKDMDLEDSPDGGARVLHLSQAVEEASATWRFRVHEDGQYAIWGRAMHRHGEPTAFDVVIDDEVVGEWQVWGRWGQWLWSPMGKKVTGSPELFNLTRGRHTLALVAKTATAWLGDVVITDDPTWWPMEGFKGENMDV